MPAEVRLHTLGGMPKHVTQRLIALIGAGLRRALPVADPSARRVVTHSVVSLPVINAVAWLQGRLARRLLGAPQSTALDRFDLACCDGTTTALRGRNAGQAAAHPTQAPQKPTVNAQKGLV
jgi:hypothetical protein